MPRWGRPTGIWRGAVVLEVLGREPIGLTGPWGHYRRLQDRPDIPRILHHHRYRYLRALARNAHGGLPVPADWRPFWYQPQRFPDVLEPCIHGCQDEFYWEAFARPGPGETYPEHLKKVADRVPEHDLVWSVPSRDHGCATEEGFGGGGLASSRSPRGTSGSVL